MPVATRRYAAPMQVETADEIFVRASRRAVHPYLADVAGYGAWWPGVRSRPAAGGAVLDLRPPRIRDRAYRLRVHVAKDRRALGVLLTVRGQFAGNIEWYYLDEPDGTVVHAMLRATTGDRCAARRVEAHRACVVAGLLALKGLLESGRRTGEEPTEALRGEQERGRAAFRARVEAHRRTMGRAER
jgi:hypothetical protein